MAVCLWTAGPAAAAYLPLVGPGPLRFERPARPPKVAPPVPTENPPATTAEATAEPAPPPPPPPMEPPAGIPNTAPATLEIGPPPAPTPTNQTVRAAPPAAQGTSAATEPEITPQMLVQYFKMPPPAAGTNTAGVVVTLPLFQPPQPGRIPPSSARYETPEPPRSTP